jgi:hypothetical protein
MVITMGGYESREAESKKTLMWHCDAILTGEEQPRRADGKLGRQLYMISGTLHQWLLHDKRK